MFKGSANTSKDLMTVEEKNLGFLCMPVLLNRGVFGYSLGRLSRTDTTRGTLLQEASGKPVSLDVWRFLNKLTD